MTTEQLRSLLIIAEDAAKQSPTPYVHMSAESCVELVREVLEARGVEFDEEGK